MADVDVAIVGGGMAGLACALRCAEHGIGCTLIESHNHVGGRVRTDVIDGFRLDRGFQVYLTAYQDAGKILDYEALELCPFVPGADVFANGRFHRVSDPRRRPTEALRALFSPVVTLRDTPAIFKLATRWAPGRLDLEQVPDITAEEALRQAGVSPRAIDGFFRPFFGGVFFDRDLHTSARMLAFCFSMFAAGSATLPARGMQQIPEHIAAQLPAGTIQLGVPVASIEGTTVRLESGAAVTARAVVVATESHTAARLTGREDLATNWRKTTTLWFACDAPPTEEPILMLNGEGRGLVNHLAVVSNAAPMYSPDSRCLIAANVVDQAAPTGAALVDAVRGQLNRWYGNTAQSWQHLHTHTIDHALPDQLVKQVGGTKASILARTQRPITLAEGLYVCGDHRDNASINGAVASGQRAADTVAAQLRDS